MKKIKLQVVLFLVCYSAFSQVGINTTTPKATFEIVGNPTNLTSIDGIIIPRLTGNELKAKDALYSVNQTGTLVYCISAASPTSSKTQEVSAPGLYIFDGTNWKAYLDTNLYKDNGSITAGANRIVTIPNSTNLNFTAVGNGNISTTTANGIISLSGNQDNGSIQLKTWGSNGDIILATNGNSSDILLNPEGTNNVGIGTLSPSTKLHVNSNSNPAFRLVDGTESNGKVLTSDAVGNASWQTIAVKQILGNLPSTGPNITTNNTMTLINGASITLPPGKWIVSLGTNAGIGGSTPITSDVGLWFNATLSSSSTSVNTSDVVNTSSGTHIGGALGRGMIKTLVSGNIVINNTSTNNKTYYLWASREAVGGSSSLGWTNAFGNAYWERWFYAIPVN